MRWDDDKHWPNMVNVIKMMYKIDGFNASKFRYMFNKLSNTPLKGNINITNVPNGKGSDYSLQHEREITTFFKKPAAIKPIDKPTDKPPVDNKPTDTIPQEVIVIKSDDEAKKYRKLGFYVYMISHPEAPFVKIGKHTGDLHQLRMRYNTPDLWGGYEIYAFPTANNILVEKGLHTLLDSFELREVKNQEKFKNTEKTREIFFGTSKFASILDVLTNSNTML